MRHLFGFLCVCALGLMPLVGCSETTGDGGTGGTGGVQKGACTNQEDVAIVCAPDFVDGAFTCGSRTIGRCDAGDAECVSEISSECLQEEHNMSADCGDCFGDGTACVFANCDSCISGVNSQECLACRAEHCNDALYACSGDIVSGCDGEVWCQHVDCDDYVDCTENVCNPVDGVCSYQAVGDGASCAGGMCQSGACALTGTVLPCTEQGIRNAVAAGGGPYTFNCDAETRIVTQGEIVIDEDVILDGGGEMIVDGDRDHRVFSIAQGATVELGGFGITRGWATDGRADFPEGAGIANHGTLKLADCFLEDNGPEEEHQDMGPTQPEVRGAGVFNDGTLTLVNTTVVQNTGFAGGGIWNDGDLALTESHVFQNVAIDAEGGGIHNARAGTVTLTKSTVEANRANGGGGISNDGMLTLTESQVSWNEAGERGGGLFNNGALTLSATELSQNHAGETGGGVENAEGGTLTMRESTVSSNHADLAGGVFNSGTLTLMNSTVSWNGAFVLGGIWNDHNGALSATNSTVSGNNARFLVGGIYNDGTLALTSTTVSKNDEDRTSAILNTGLLTVTQSLVSGDCNGAIGSNGYNIESPGDTCGFDQTGDQPSVTEEDLNLGELANNSGPTMTHLPGGGDFGEDSAAIDKIPGDACNVTTDQRGEPRPETGGTMCDVGSVEVQPEL